MSHKILEPWNSDAWNWNIGSYSCHPVSAARLQLEIAPESAAAMAASASRRPQSIAIIGGGVAGLQALRSLERLPQLEKIAARQLGQGFNHQWLMGDKNQ